MKTNAELLRDSSFVDGRTPITLEAPVTVLLGDLTARVKTGDAEQPDRFLFNSSFCGSTLLSRLLDVPGRSLVLKEPMCLADLATWKMARIRAGRPIDALGSLLSLARSALRRQFVAGEAVTVKPGNWTNILIESLVKDPARVRPVFLTISRADYLLAIFRGGPQRMHHAAKIAWQMVVDEADGDAMLREAMAAGSDPLRKAANVALLSRFLQVGIFQRAALAGNWSKAHVIDLQDIATAPLDAAAKAVAALDLNIDPNDLERNVARHVKRYAKQPENYYSAERRHEEDRAVRSEYRAVFDDALRWARTTLGPERDVVPA